MSRYNDQILDNYGRPVPGAAVYVYDDAGALEALTDDAALALDNPLKTDSFGNFYFNADDGEKTIDVWFGGMRRWREEILVGPQPTGPKGDRGFDGASGVSVTAFGAVGDGVTDDYGALQAWLDNGGDLYLPAGEFYSSKGLVVRKQVRVRGAGYGFDARVAGYSGMPGSRIRFANDATVSRLFDVQPQTTITDIATVLADVTAAFTQEGAYGSTFRDFALIGPNAGVADGFYARTVVHVENVHAVEFGGRGFTLMGTADMASAGDEYGNVSTATLTNTVALENGSHGLHIRGRDASACKVTGHNSRTNGGWGLLDESLLGNHYDQPHLAGNTLGAIKAIGAVSNSQISHPYIEGDVFSNCEIGGANVIIGSDLSAINVSPDASPAMYGGSLTTLRRVKFVWGEELSFAYPIANMCMAYRHSNLGLVLAGQGGLADAAILNKNGDTVLTVATGTQNVSFKGNPSLDGVDPIFRLGGSGGVGPQLIMANGGVDKLQIYASAGSVYVSADSLVLRDKATLASIATITNTGIDLAAGKVLKVAGTQVVGGQGAAVANGVNAVAAPTKAEFDALVTQFNALLARCRAHGLIAP